MLVNLDGQSGGWPNLQIKEIFMRFVTLIFGLLALLLVATSPVAAQETGEPIVPDPELCTLEPTTRDRIDAIIAMDLVAATPLADAGFGTPVALPEGAPVSPELQTEIEEAMTINVACLNTGDVLTQMSIYSDMGVRRLLGESAQPITDDEFAQISTPTALEPDQMTAIYDFSDAIDLGDGRVAIVIVGDDMSQPDPASPTLFVLVQQDGHWVVDSFEATED